MAKATLPRIGVDQLQLGMYVVLDVGWRNHPFLRSSFTIRSEEQLQQLRSLGWDEVSYDPARSHVETPATPPEVTELPASAQASEETLAPESPSPASPMPRMAAAAAWLDQERQTESEWQETRLRQVEGEYSDVSRRHQRLLQQLATQPEQARATAEELREVVCESVLDCDVPAVRLLSERVDQTDSSHEVGVAALATLLGRDAGLDEAELKDLALAALLHDAGKTRLPGAVQEDSPRLAAGERQRHRQHVELGVEIAQRMQLPTAVVRAIAEHHEHADGSGYPAGLKGEQISPIGRILAIANRYVSLVSPRDPASGLTPHQALQQMFNAERAHFDADFLARFVRVLGVYPPGTLVELTDQRRALVVASRPGSALTPWVQIIDTEGETTTGESIDLQSEGELRVKRSLPPTQLNPRWAERSRELARTPVYIEPQTGPEWAAWEKSDAEPIQTF